MQLRSPGNRLALQQAFDQVDAAARTIQFITQQLVGRTNRSTESSMYAAAQDGIGLPALRGLCEVRGKPSLH